MARPLLRKSTSNNIRVSGELVKTLQEGLSAAGCSVGTVDGIFGGDTDRAVRSWQAQQGRAQDGVVMFDDWTAITGRPVPSCADRALQVTASFEGTGFGKIVGNFDGAWLTWGIIGFTLKHGELGRLLRTLETRNLALLEQAFGVLLPRLLSVIHGTPQDQESFADQISFGANRYKVDPPWAEAFARLGSFADVQALQLQAVEKYFSIARRDVGRFGLVSELGFGLCFDVAVQNGGIDNDQEERSIRRRLAQNPPAHERDIRAVIAEVVAENSRPQYAADVLSRKMTWTTGMGTVHGSAYDLSDWGVGEFPA